MEELVPIIIIFVVSSIVSSMKKSKQAADAQRRSTAAPVYRPQAAKPSSPTIQTAPVRSSAPASRPDAAVQVMTPTVHLHVDPDCAAHDAPGSLGVTSAEGKDPCHEDQLTHARTADAEVPQEGGLTFDWSGENMVKAFVMQEVLTRPAQRRAR